MDRWAWDQLDPWLEIRRELPIGALLCVIHGPTAGRRWEASAARKQLHHSAAAAAAGVGRRFASTNCGTRTRSRWRTKGGHLFSCSGGHSLTARVASWCSAS
jgi:hypothetical protein